MEEKAKKWSYQENISSENSQPYYAIIGILCRSEVVSLICIDYLKLWN